MSLDPPRWRYRRRRNIVGLIVQQVDNFTTPRNHLGQGCGRVARYREHYRCINISPGYHSGSERASNLVTRFCDPEDIRDNVSERVFFDSLRSKGRQIPYWISENSSLC